MGKRDAGQRVGDVQGDVCKERIKQAMLGVGVGRKEVGVIRSHLEP